MRDNERELIEIVRGSEEPEKVMEYFFNLFSDYLRKHDPSQEKLSADLQESV